MIFSRLYFFHLCTNSGSNLSHTRMNLLQRHIVFRTIKHISYYGNTYCVDELLFGIKKKLIALMDVWSLLMIDYYKLCYVFLLCCGNFIIYYNLLKHFYTHTQQPKPKIIFNSFLTFMSNTFLISIRIRFLLIEVE